MSGDLQEECGQISQGMCTTIHTWCGYIKVLVETLKDSFKVVVKGFRIVCDFVHIPSQFHLNEKLQVSLFCLLAVGESVAAKELILFEESMLVEILCVEKEDLATPPDRVTASSRQSEKQRNTQVVCL